MLLVVPLLDDDDDDVVVVLLNEDSSSNKLGYLLRPSLIANLKNWYISSQVQNAMNSNFNAAELPSSCEFCINGGFMVSYVGRSAAICCNTCLIPMPAIDDRLYAL